MWSGLLVADETGDSVLYGDICIVLWGLGFAGRPIEQEEVETGNIGCGTKP